MGTLLTGHSSAASFPTGPVMAEPFISPFGLTICARVPVSTMYQRPNPCLLIYAPKLGGARSSTSNSPLASCVSVIELPSPCTDDDLLMCPEACEY